MADDLHPVVSQWVTILREAGKSDSTIKGYRRGLVHFVAWYRRSGGGPSDLSAVMPRNVRDWIAFEVTIVGILPPVKPGERLHLDDPSQVRRAVQIRTARTTPPCHHRRYPGVPGLQPDQLYTAITRAKGLVVLVGTRRAVGIAVTNDKVRKRHSGLRARLERAL